MAWMLAERSTALDNRPSRPSTRLRFLRFVVGSKGLDSLW
jgi:hypothetical protein